MQDPKNERKRIYKVFESIRDQSTNSESISTSLTARAAVPKNKAVRQALVDNMATKASALSAESLFPTGTANTNRGSGRGGSTRKTPKELTPEQKAKKELDRDLAMSLGCAHMYVRTT